MQHRFVDRVRVDHQVALEDHQAHHYCCQQANQHACEGQSNAEFNTRIGAFQLQHHSEDKGNHNWQVEDAHPNEGAPFLEGQWRSHQLDELVGVNQRSDTVGILGDGVERRISAAAGPVANWHLDVGGLQRT